MSFSQYSLQAAAAAVAVGVAILTAAPAQAMAFGDALTLAGESRLQVAGNTAVLDFSDAPIGTLAYGTDSGLAAVGGSSDAVFRTDSGGNLLSGALAAVLKDLDLVSSAPNVWELATGPVTSFLTFEYNQISFDLNSFSLRRVGISNSWEANIAGVFRNANIAGLGTYTTQGSNFTEAQGTTYSSTITAVPTPALLPGLVGLGFAAIRKRKQNDSEANA